jgi:hypothetical protein
MYKMLPLHHALPCTLLLPRRLLGARLVSRRAHQLLLPLSLPPLLYQAPVHKAAALALPPLTSIATADMTRCPTPMQYTQPPCTLLPLLRTLYMLHVFTLMVAIPVGTARLALSTPRRFG